MRVIQPVARIVESPTARAYWISWHEKTVLLPLIVSRLAVAAATIRLMTAGTPSGNTVDAATTSTLLGQVTREKLTRLSILPASHPQAGP